MVVWNLGPGATVTRLSLFVALERRDLLPGLFARIGRDQRIAHGSDRAQHRAHLEQHFQLETLTPASFCRPQLGEHSADLGKYFLQLSRLDAAHAIALTW